jgi:hypothetical protein
MKALASFVMRGWSQATGVAVLCALLSPILAPLSLVSAAIVALVTLRNGPVPGLQVAGAAGLVTVLAGQLVFGQPLAALAFALLLWVPMIVLALVLRYTRSLASTLQAALLFGVVLVGFYVIGFDDPVAEWKGLLETVLGGFFEAQQIAEADRAALVEAMARWMTGTLAAAYFLQLAASLLLARWWQSLLYNPGGFRQEFHALRLSRVLALVALPLFAAVFFEGLPALLRYLALPVAAAFFLQGLALAHGQLAAMKAGPGWLIGIYALLVVAPPYAFMALTTAGYADAWMDFRGRATKRPGGQDPS